MRTLALLIAMLPLTVAAAPDACRATSGATLRPLVELYTSEGCNSCPPADRWLSQHFGADARATALAFHVDYWDGLGWKDRFASAAYTARQHQAMRANRATFVYTPQVLLQGRDYGAWRGGSPENALAVASARAPKATIGMGARVAREAVDADVAVELAGAPTRPAFVALAYVDSGLSSDVKAGENRGERLRHDHVVRALVTRNLDGPKASIALRVPRPAEAGERAMLVAFVQDAANGDVLQTLEMPLEGCR